MLTALHAVEEDLGRTRTLRWGARSCDLDLLAALHRQQIDVVDLRADRVALDVLEHGQVLLAVIGQDLDHGVGIAGDQHHVVARQGHVDGIVTGAVDDGGDLVGLADAAGVALAEVGADLAGDLGGISHGGSS